MSKEKQIAEICAITSNACCIGCEETPFVPESSGICDYLDCRSCKEARLLLNAGYRKQEWISVEERLPEECTHVIVHDEDGTVGEAFHSIADHFEWVANEKMAFVTHWMPLPSLPEKEKNDD